MTRLPRLGVLAALLLVALTSRISAQAPGDTSAMTRAGRWGAELDYYGNTGVNLLYFSTPKAAWRLGASFAAGGQTSDQPNYQSIGTTRESSSYGYVELRAGRRWYSGDSHERLRPLTGLGLLGSYSGATNGSSWGAGGYGELGAAWFFTPHVSLGAAGELTYTRSHRRQTLSGVGDLVQNDWMLRGNLASITAAVYF